jgi:hypothetical protein
VGFGVALTSTEVPPSEPFVHPGVHMEWLAQEERLDVQVSVAVRVGGTVAFGTLLWLDGGRLLIEVDGDFQDGETAEIRLDLTPLAGTALIHAQVHRQLVTAPDEMARFVFRPSTVADDDAERFQGWLGQMRVGGTVKDLSTLSNSRERAPQSTWHERHATLQRVDARLRTTPAPAAGADRPSEQVRNALREVARRRLSTPNLDTPSVDVPLPE